MSDESIIFKEDKEDLLYIARKINMDEFTLSGEQSWTRESLESETSIQTEHEGITKSQTEFLNEKMETEMGPEIFKDPSVLLKTRPFNMVWSYGCNPKVDIINLTDAETNEIIFASSHFPIIYNYCEKKMSYLEGHHYTVVAISIDRTGKYFVTADNGEDGFINIWDGALRNTETGKIAPILSLYGIYQKFGVSTAHISPCARYLVTIGGVKEDLYSIDMWLWTLGNNSPEDSFILSNTHGYPIAIRFNPNIEEHIMVIFSKSVFLLFWDKDLMKFTLKISPQIMHRSKIGHLTTGTYVDQCHECYASSSKGCILTFSNALYAKPFEEGELDNNKIFRNAVKISDVAVDCCNSIDGLVVAGDTRGRIFFFNKRLMILYWLTTFNLGPISSVSFNLVPKVKLQETSQYFFDKTTEEGIMNCDFLDKVEELEVLFKQDLPKNATINRAPFVIRDFFIATAQSNIYSVDVINHKCVPLFHVADGYVAAIETHEESDYIIIAYKSNRIILMNYLTNEVLCASILPKGEDESAAISCIKYDSKSLHLVCGKTNGEVWVLDPILLEPKQPEPFQITKNKIVKFRFSVSPIQFAYFDENRTMVIFQYNNDGGKWEFKGKIRPHYGDITDILYIPVKKCWKLYSIAADRHIIEYNNDKLDTEDFAVQSSERIEQTAIPICMIYWVLAHDEKKMGYILLADDKHKLKFLYHVSKIPKSVILAPAYGCFKYQLIKKMQIIPHCDSKYMAFSTNRHCGIHILPPDGNPYKYVGYLTHPVKLEDFALSRDGVFMFTFGINDHCVFKWSIETKSVENMKHLGGKELEPFYCLIEGGYHGWLFHEIKDLFYYMQILQQENIDLPRRVSDTINISEIPDLFRTIGFYPSDFELENIMIDVRFRNMDETNKTNEDISFTEFVKLYCNHKPVYGYSLKNLEDVFTTVLETQERRHATFINRDKFVELLTTQGEPMTTSSAFQCFRSLMRIEQEEVNFDFLPEKINFEVLFEDILGIDMARKFVLEPKESSEEEEVDFKKKHSGVTAKTSKN